LIRSNIFKPLFKPLMMLFALDLLILGWIGGQPVEEPYFIIGQAATIFYFGFFVFFGVASVFEHYVLKFYNYLR
jgi:ubiquinol-cytochrome c reductase cytochrome b subunit